jgi:hypothetical protein
VPHRRGSRPAGRPLAREELGEKRGAQPPTLDFLDLGLGGCARR